MNSQNLQDTSRLHIEKTLEWYHPHGSVFEVCAFPRQPKSGLWEGFAAGKKRVVAGWFNDRAKAAEIIGKLDALGCEGIYLTINPCADGLLSRANNRLKAGVDRTQDKDVLLIRHLLVDIDPKRPAGISSTNEEHDFAIQHARTIIESLKADGWPEPLLGDSGNGAHLIYKVLDLDDSPETVDLIKRVLMALNERFRVYREGIKLEIDQKVFNPSRISKVYGTFARKGDNTGDRPHRFAKILKVPKEPKPVPVEILREAAMSIEEPSKTFIAPSARAESGKFDLDAYLQHHGIIVKKAKEHGSAVLRVLDHCLFNASHSDGEAAIGQAADGKLFYQCFHDSCRGRTWADARKTISGDAKLKEFMGSGNGSPLSRAGSNDSGASHCSRETSEWEPEILEWPTLSEEALRGIAGEFTRLATRKCEADPAAVLVTFILRFAAEIGNKPFLMVGDSKHYARLFAAVVGDTAKARKGTSHGPVDRCFSGLASFRLVSCQNNYQCARSTPGPLSSGEGLIFAVRDPIERATTDKKTRELTIEVVDPGVTDKRLFVCDEELGGALSCTKREGNTLSTVIRCAWDHGNQDPLTKTSKITTTRAHIVVVGHITRAELRRKLEDAEAFNGFANRFLWVCARRNGIIPFPEPMPEDELRDIQRQLIEIITHAQSVGQIGLSEEAKRLWVNLYPEISADHDGLAGAVVNRAEAQVLRLSMLYALLGKCSIIGEEHLRSALAMWAYCKQSAEYVFHGFEADPISDRILKKVQAEGQVEWTVIYALFSNNVSKQTIDSAVNDLLRKGKVTIDRLNPGERGRPKRILTAVAPGGITSLISFSSSRKGSCEGVCEKEGTDVNHYEINEVNTFINDTKHIEKHDSPTLNTHTRTQSHEENEINEVIPPGEPPFIEWPDLDTLPFDEGEDAEVF